MENRACIFVGPTLRVEEARSELDAVYLPPAAQGDVYRVARERPLVIGIIDGYFERLPAVWHKEILWALSQRIHVFGAASMGALRAAELATFGMRGVGAIYEAYRSGELEDDDEVAVVHGDEDTRYRPSSEALVNIRATLRSAEAAGILDAETREQLERIAKDTFYPDRSYAALLLGARERGMSAALLESLRDFIRANKVDRKREDAMALLGAVRECLATGERPAEPAFFLSHTNAWDQLVDWAQQQPPLIGPQGSRGEAEVK